MAIVAFRAVSRFLGCLHIVGPGSESAIVLCAGGDYYEISTGSSYTSKQAASVLLKAGMCSALVVV